MKSKHIINLFFLVVLLEMLGGLVFELREIPYGIWIFKPLLMPLLMFWYYKETKAKLGFDKIILVSLFFSWWGDNFLMPAIFKTDINFLLGLASFLVAHVLYIVAFVKTNMEHKSVLKAKPYLVLPFILIGAGLISFLSNENLPEFNEMKIPVMIYAFVIMIMVVIALNRYKKVSNKSFQLVFIGALLFMVSDSVIAINKFSTIFDGIDFLAGLLIMTLYALGQYYIIKGCILQSNAE